MTPQQITMFMAGVGLMLGLCQMKQQTEKTYRMFIQDLYCHPCGRIIVKWNFKTITEETLKRIFQSKSLVNKMNDQILALQFTE